MLENLAQLYQYDFNEFDGGTIGADGRFGWVDLGVLYSHDVHHAFVIEVDGSIAGFATMYLGESFRDPRERVWWMSDFFVMRAFRGRGVGRRAATMLFDRFPGTWEIAQIRPNLVAQGFWREVIGSYAGSFEEVDMDDGRWSGPVQYFTSGGRR